MTVFPQPIYNFVAVSAPYAAVSGDNVLVTTGSTAGVAITLPPNPVHGATVAVRKVDSGAGSFKLVTTDGSAVDTVAGTAGVTSSTSQHAGFSVASDGANWWIVGV